MEDEKEKQDDFYITISDMPSHSHIFTTSSTSIDYTIDATSNCIVTYSGNTFFTHNDPYQELEETKQQQEKEEELREENLCLQEAWDEYQLILKLLEENECDKFVEKRYGMNK